MKYKKLFCKLKLETKKAPTNVSAFQRGPTWTIRLYF